MLPTSIECLYCKTVVDSKISTGKTLDLMKAHVKKEHPSKPQI